MLVKGYLALTNWGGKSHPKWRWVPGWIRREQSEHNYSLFSASWLWMQCDQPLLPLPPHPPCPNVLCPQDTRWMTKVRVTTRNHEDPLASRTEKIPTPGIRKAFMSWSHDEQETHWSRKHREQGCGRGAAWGQGAGLTFRGSRSTITLTTVSNQMRRCKREVIRA